MWLPHRRRCPGLGLHPVAHFNVQGQQAGRQEARGACPAEGRLCAGAVGQVAEPAQRLQLRLRGGGSEGGGEATPVPTGSAGGGWGCQKGAFPDAADAAAGCAAEVGMAAGAGRRSRGAGCGWLEGGGLQHLEAVLRLKARYGGSTVVLKCTLEPFLARIPPEVFVLRYVPMLSIWVAWR
jgi:hypothetical protein